MLQTSVAPSIASPDNPAVTLTATATSFDGTPITDLQDVFFTFRTDFSDAQIVPASNGTASLTIRPPLQGSQARVSVTLDRNGEFASLARGNYLFDVRSTPLATALVGSYVFQTRTFSGTTSGGEGASVGSLEFQAGPDGGYTVTGNLDYNGKLGTFQYLPFTGTYSLDNSGHGRMTLTSSAGTQNFNLLVNPQEYAGSQTISQASLSEVDGPRIAGTGQIFRRLDNPPVINEPPTNSLLNLAGQIDTAAGSFPVSLTGTLASLTSVIADEAVGSFVRQGASLAFAPENNLGRPNRVVFTLSDPAQPALPRHYVAYALNPTSYYAISLDPTASTAVLSGTITAPYNP